MIQLIKKTDINFIGKRKKAFICSAIVILIGIISLILHGGPKYNIDFEGGHLLQLKFEKPVAIEEVRSSLSTVGLGESEIQHFGAADEIIIRSENLESEEPITEVMKSCLTEYLSDNPFEIRRVETVGPKIGKELQLQAIYAILLGMLGMLVYIAWRFEFRFAVAAIVALFHDVLITIGLFSLLEKEISLPVIAALLTIVGYSINDTIVVFDRIRENLKLYRKEKYDRVFNISINQTLNRTVITSLTTLIVVIVLYFLGGEVIHDFAFALLIGIVVGSYSSIFVASPLLIEWEILSPEKKRKL